MSGEAPSRAVSVDGFRSALALWASGVCVVTANDEGLLYGLTVSSFSSVSLDPPLILVCLSNANRLAQMVESTGAFAVSLLATDQAAASTYFARAGRLPTPDFTEIAGEWTPSGLPVIAGALAWLTCDLHARMAIGDHTVVIGRVTETFARDGHPLVYWSRGYRQIAT